MDYLEWNDAVAAYLFNEDKAGETVFLYLTRDEITGSIVINRTWRGVVMGYGKILSRH